MYKDEMKTVSIVMATYNSIQYLDEQISSILNQTYSKFELIVVDDCSTDNTCDMLRSYNDNRIKLVINNSNIGCAKSFEKGISMCSGDYVVLSDHDDIWHQDKIERMILNIGDADLVYSDCEIINSYGKQVKNSYKNDNRLIGLDSSYKNFQTISAFNSFILGCSIMFKSKWISTVIPIHDTSWNHDKWIVYNIALLGKVKYFEETTFKYRIHNANLSIKIDKRTMFNKIIDIFYKSPKPLTIEYNALKNIYEKARDIDRYRSEQCLELINSIGKGKIYFFLKYRNYMFLRYKVPLRIKNIFVWIIKPYFNN